jgi:hypothetical protein
MDPSADVGHRPAEPGLSDLTGRLRGMDPTGMSGPLGQLVIAAGFIAAIVVGIMALRRRK